MLLQGFCLFHAYRNNNHQKWYWLIIFLPGIGCLIYLYENFYNKRNIDGFSEGLKGIFNANYNIEKLEKEAKFSGTVTNKIALADAYTNKGRYDDALALYESCRQGFYQNNTDLLQKMLRVYFLRKDYSHAAELGKQLENVKNFNVSEEKVAYAWSMHYTGQTDQAEKIFSEMNMPFSNFQHRIEFAKFYDLTGKPVQARSILQAMLEEYDAMEGYEKSLKRPQVTAAKSLLSRLR